MGLNIKNEETVRLVRELADELHVSLTAAITDAVEARLAEIRAGPKDVEAEAQRILEMWGELGDRLGREYLSQDFDALLYDEQGLPK
jgi:antitoxin VapB